jgi:NAD(P)-dependent dehydrogenase (short-subunit alcohol dehydrogenase family)
MDLGLAGKRAVVTGASRGIGFAIASALAGEGVDVVLAARDSAALKEAAARIDGPGRAVPVVTDTNDDVSVRALFERAAEEFGGVDILVNAAAQPSQPGFGGKLAAVTDDALRGELETKVLGYLRCARAAAPYMTAQGWGRIISVSGLAARQTGSIIGSIRNVAVAAMTKNLADELGPSGVNVTVVHPGMTVTERTPVLTAAISERQGVSEDEVARSFAAATSIGRVVTAAEIADVVTFLASPLSVAITGDAIGVGGGAKGAIHY